MSWILGKVEVKESGINDYAGGDNDFGQYEPPGEVRKIGELVSLTVNGDELLIKDGVLATDQGGQRLFVLEKSEVKR